jgi:hypothetical protein
MCVGCVLRCHKFYDFTNMSCYHYFRQMATMRGACNYAVSMFRIAIYAIRNDDVTFDKKNNMLMVCYFYLISLLINGFILILLGCDTVYYILVNLGICLGYCILYSCDF